MSLRVAQIGLGPLGIKVVADLVARKLGRVVAVVDPAADLVGKSVGELVDGAGDTPIVASLGEVADWNAVDVAVVTTSSDLDLVMETLRELLNRGRTIVSTCEELAWPWLRHPVHAQELHERAVRNGGRVLGTGVNPGFLMDAFAVAATTACRSVRSIQVTRIQDAGARRIPFQRKVGAGLTDEEFEARKAEGSLRHVGLGESLHLVAHTLGMKLDRWEETLEPVRAEADLTCDLGPIAAGGASGVRQVGRGWIGDDVGVELVFQAAVGQEDPHDRVVVDGDPPLDLCFAGGVHGDVATTAIVLNTVRALRAAPPGLHTMVSLPLMGCTPPGS